jgi:hypothetical protein
MRNLWILTEERPKIEVLRTILELFSADTGGAFIDHLRIIPILTNNKFTFVYELIGFKSGVVEKVFIKTISGTGSFVDYLIYHQLNEPQPNEEPLYAIEETKTDDAESRNTGVFQRATKFVLVKTIYPTSRLIMLYNIQVEQKKIPTETNVFGTRCFETLGVEILGKKTHNKGDLTPFSSVEELINSKNSMRSPPAGNVPIKLKRDGDTIYISGRLIKANRLSHDPNIGALSLISATLRKLGWNKNIVLTRHGLSQSHLTPTNKMILMCRQQNVSIEGLSLPSLGSRKIPEYWKYENKGEKLGTIFLHLVVESFTNGFSIFENHAGCEKGYFFGSDKKPYAIQKYINKEKYKAGDHSQIVHIPDLILVDSDREKVINIEGKKLSNIEQGIIELDNFDAIESLYIKPHYPKHSIIRTVVLYGGQGEIIKEVAVGFLLNENGQMIIGPEAPCLFKEAIDNLTSAFGMSI